MCFSPKVGALEHLPTHNPIHGLQAVGGRLADAIAWQESWAHPAAFGFRPATSALDGAAVTQVLLERCRLRGWAVAGMSINYVKCFDLIPQAVVLALALELGMDTGTCRALGAMYKQLCRAFKIAGALGRWWQATNGILQGYTLLVILVNVLTTIWKWEVDALRRQVCAQTATLPPTLDAEAATDLEVGAPLPLKDAGPGYAALGRQAMRTTLKRWPWGRPPCRRRSPRRRSGKNFLFLTCRGWKTA